MSDLRKQYNAIPAETRLRITRLLHKEGNTRVLPSSQEVVDYYNKHLKTA